jgi:uracil-DNA glycosylase
MQLPLPWAVPDPASSAAEILEEQRGPRANEDPAADRLSTANPMDWEVDASWREAVDAFLAGDQAQRLLAFLRSRLEAGAVIYPPQPLRALALTPRHAVRVCILGQDPYHGRGQAEGLAFSVAQGVAVPPSLRNIFKEIARDSVAAQSVFPLTGGSLLEWAQRGVLLLNTCLTVEEGQPASHANRGWEALTDTIIRGLSGDSRPRVFMLWGAHAQSKSGLIDSARHLVLTANHPSPLSATRPPMPFVGCGHFGKAVEWLQRGEGKLARSIDGE